MGVDNLAIDFASNILRPEHESESSSFSLGRLETLLRTFINYVDELFENSTESSEDVEDENWMEDVIKFCYEDEDSWNSPTTQNINDTLDIPNIPRPIPIITALSAEIILPRSISSPEAINSRHYEELPADSVSWKRGTANYSVIN